MLVAAPGPLSEPSIPDLPGLDEYTGTVFHTATWNHDHDLRGRRVAVVGTGASAIQAVPEVAQQAAHLDVIGEIVIEVRDDKHGHASVATDITFAGPPPVGRALFR